MEQKNHFVFIIPFRNVQDYIGQCANSLINQTYQNWTAIFCDDCSNDYTLSRIPEDSRFKIRKNSERVTALPNIAYALLQEEYHKEDIICMLDGDDFLLDNNSLMKINDLYSDESTLLTYGQYTTGNAIGHCREMDAEYIENIRGSQWYASHLKTFKYKLFQEFLKQDSELSSYKDNDGNFYQMTYDVAMMLPLIEIAGHKNIKFCSEPVYYYRFHPNNDHVINIHLQTSIEKEIWLKPKFKNIF
jgi:glycosyltransferase involved in cell wall biosynthesis